MSEYQWVWWNWPLAVFPIARRTGAVGPVAMVDRWPHHERKKGSDAENAYFPQLLGLGRSAIFEPNPRDPQPPQNMGAKPLNQTILNSCISICWNMIKCIYRYIDIYIYSNIFLILGISWNQSWAVWLAAPDSACGSVRYPSPLHREQHRFSTEKTLKVLPGRCRMFWHVSTCVSHMCMLHHFTTAFSRMLTFAKLQLLLQLLQLLIFSIPHSSRGPSENRGCVSWKARGMVQSLWVSQALCSAGSRSRSPQEVSNCHKKCHCQWMECQN